MNAIGRITASLLFLAFGTAAFAQQPAPPKFVPYTISAQEHGALLTYLGEVPAKYANPLINQLSMYEQQAQEAAAKTALPGKPNGALAPSK